MKFLYDVCFVFLFGRKYIYGLILKYIDFLKGRFYLSLDFFSL